MKKNMKQCVAMLLSALMTVSIAGCSNSTDTLKSGGEGASSENSSDDASKTIQLDMFSALANYQGIQSGWYAKILKDKFNIELNIIAPNVAGGGDQLYQTRSAAGNLGDIVIVRNDQMKDCINAGIIMDITDYITDKENLNKYSLAIDNLKNYLGTDKVYAIPTNASTESPLKASLNGGNKTFYGNYMPWDYYKELGCPDIQDANALLDVLEQMVKLHPTTESGKKTYAFSLFKDWDGGYMSMAAKIACMYGYSELTSSIFANADATKTQVITDDNGVYLKALKLYFNANQRGLLDPDSASQNFDTMYAKIKDKQIMYLWYNWMIGNYNTLDKGNNEDGYVFIPVDDQLITNDGYNPYGNGYCIGIGANAGNPEKIMKFLDWWASPEGMSYYASGLEGLAYTIENGKPVTTEYGLTAWSDNSPVPDEYGGGNYKDGSQQINSSIVNTMDTNPNTGEAYLPDLWSSTLNDFRTKIDDAWTEQFTANSPIDYLEQNNMIAVIPGCNYIKPTEESELQNKRTQCETVIKETSWKMVFAKDEDEFYRLWDNMKEQLKGFGFDDVVSADTEIALGYRESRAQAIKEAN
jgi:putative aldouronate transport system substrate-binding protein